MRVLVVNGYERGREVPVVDRIVEVLGGHGHDPHRFDLAEAGFDAFMSAEERAAYHSDDPLITPEAANAADEVRAATGLVVAYPIVHRTAPPRVKSWQERVFVLGVGFDFLPSGRITGALDHVERACVIGVGPPSARAGRRNDFGPCLARSFHLSSNRNCKASYLSVDESATGPIERALARW